MSALPGELAEAVIGSLFVAIGLTAAAAGFSARPRRERTAIWFGVFCAMYGIRLAAESGLVQAVVPWPESAFRYLIAFITYSILIPAGLFVETLAGRGWHGILRRTWQVICVYAVGAAANDLVRGPGASLGLNGPVVFVALGIVAAHRAGLPRTGRWAREARVVALAAAIFAVTAVYETIANRGLFGPGVDAEPFAMLLFSGTLGWFVLTRARDESHQLVALARELQLARDIQHSLLPKQMPAIPGLWIEGAYLPMSAVAGDFYDVITLPDRRVVVIVADVSGHGVPAALVASMMKVAFAAESERFDRPGDILEGINRALTGKFDLAYVTACCVVVDRAREAISYASAGHPPSLLRRADGRVERLAEGGIVLTLLPAATYATTDVSFTRGDYLLLYTDGLVEAVRPDGEEFFGDAELTRVVTDMASSEHVVPALVRAHRSWIGSDTALADDVTLVVVRSVDD